VGLFDWDLKKGNAVNPKPSSAPQLGRRIVKEKKFTGLFTGTEQRSITCYISNAVLRVVLATFYLQPR
jgi:hypothetical protein